MNFKPGDKFIYTGEGLNAEFSHMEFISFKGKDYFIQHLHFTDGRYSTPTIGCLDSFMANIRCGVWTLATPLTLELM